MGRARESDETLMAICAEAPGCFEIDPESGEPMANCVYSKLIQLGYSSTAFACSGGGDGGSINYLYHLVYPEAEAGPIDKMNPECLKPVSVIRKCKLKQSASAANNVASKDDKNAYSLSYARRKIGEYERKTPDKATRAHKPNGWIWKRISGQVGGNSLEWLHLGGVFTHLGI